MFNGKLDRLAAIVDKCKEVFYKKFLRKAMNFSEEGLK